MTDDQILREVEKRINEWFAVSGWAAENVGFRQVQKWIEQLRAGGQSA